MIDWDASGVTEEAAKSDTRVVAICDNCRQSVHTNIKSYNRILRKRGHYLCHSCALKKKWEDPDYKDRMVAIKKEIWKDRAIRKKVSDSNRKTWADPNLRNQASERAKSISPEVREKMAESNKKNWQDPGYRAKMTSINKKTWSSEDRRAQLSTKIKKKWENVDYRQHATRMNKEKWDRAEYRHKMQSVYDSQEFKEKASERSNKRWEDQEYREKVTKANKNAWKDRALITRVSKSVRRALARPEVRERISQLSKLRWEDEQYRATISEACRRSWQDPEFRKRMAINRSNQPRISSQQELFYTILDDLGIEYIKEGPETRIGFYVFDCLIPKQKKLKRNLLVEVQGDYWHLLKNVESCDKRKFTYVERYFPEHEIMYVWEKEFYSKDRVVARIKNKMGMETVAVNFNFEQVHIDRCDRKKNKEFLDLYHYLGPNRGGIVYGAYLNDKLIAVCQFSPPVRKEISSSQNYEYDQVLELSRFCIHPSYQKKNFASWFISRAVKKVIEDKSPGLLVAFSDTTVGHQGTIYKASNWILDGETRPDYWYVDKEGYVMHKKTLWDRATRMKMKEREFAEEHGYKKIWGGKKLRYVKITSA